MVAYSTIKPGDTLYQVVRQKAGNTSMMREAVYAVRIIEVNENYALASWNGNTPSRWGVYQIAKLRRTKPKPKPTMFDRVMAAREALETSDDRS